MQDKPTRGEGGVSKCGAEPADRELPRLPSGTWKPGVPVSPHLPSLKLCSLPLSISSTRPPNRHSFIEQHLRLTLSLINPPRATGLLPTPLRSQTDPHGDAATLVSSTDGHVQSGLTTTKPAAPRRHDGGPGGTKPLLFRLLPLP